jgi:GTP-binding protein YchF
VNLSSTITGLPYVGKTTLFNLLTGGHASTGALAGAEGETNIGVAKVPDERVDKLSALFKPKKTTFAEITYRDLGLAKSATPGDGISPKKLGDLRNSDALVHVVRAFADPSVPHAEGSVDALRDIATLDLELLFSDHAIVEKRLDSLEREMRSAKGPDRDLKERELAFLQRAKPALEAETPLRDLDVEPEEQRLIRGYRFLTLMPQLVVVNVDEADVASPHAALAPLRSAATNHRATAVVAVCAKLEAEIAELPADEGLAFRAELGLAEAPLDRVVHATYDLLGVTSFFTTGEDEVRAWTIHKGSTAQQAAGAIHSDLERGFIRAEVIRWDQLLKVGGEAHARKQGLLRTEGKTYQITDGDVMNVLFNV